MMITARLMLVALCWFSFPQASATMVVHRYPLVSSLPLTTMSKKDIRKVYPAGIKVTQQPLPPPLDTKLKDLANSGYPIKWYKPIVEKMQAYTTFVIHRGDLATYLNSLMNDDAGYPEFFHKEIVQRALRGLIPSESNYVLTISQKTSDFYRSLLENHRYWSNIGYTSFQSAPTNVKTWLDKNARLTESFHQKALKQCQIHLSDHQVAEISRLIALHFLNDAVKGLNYVNEGAGLPYYRRLAVNAMHTERFAPFRYNQKF